MNDFRRVICLVADGFGVGALPDAKLYHDEGADTLGHIADYVGGLRLPNLEKLGLGCLGAFKGIPAAKNPQAIVSRLREKSAGKDTTTGHWEIAGVVTKTPFSLYPDGFPKNLLEAFIKEAGIPGILGNKAASGTAIIEELGEEHIQSGKPIVYTSGDSVFQIAAHEKYFGLEKLLAICEVARKLTLPLQIGRVIARPFIGEGRGRFQRTENRRDLSIVPGTNALDVLATEGIGVYSVGKIEDIFAHRGFKACNHTGNNADSLDATYDFFEKNRNEKAFIFANLVDFDQLYGHRRDPKGYAKSLVALDQYLPTLLDKMTDKDLLILTADHGCDPTFRGSDHTREYVPLIAYSPGWKGKRIADRDSFSDIAATLLDVYGIKTWELPDLGKSFV